MRTAAETLLADVAGICPCYFVTGNHEYRKGDEVLQGRMAILEKYGIVRLTNESRNIVGNGQPINICGVNDLSGFAWNEKKTMLIIFTR